MGEIITDFKIGEQGDLFRPRMETNGQMVFVGIDPGNSGGIAVINGDDVQAWKMPGSYRDIFDLLAHIGKPAFAYMEQVHSMPGQGVTSMFTFGKNAGALEMALIAAKIPFELVSPQKWQKTLLIKKRKVERDHERKELPSSESKTSFKNRLKAKAQQLFPQITVTHAIGDALLLAEYCRRIKR